MCDDLVKRLREHNGWALNETLDAAANAIEELSMKLHGDEAAIAGMKREIERMILTDKHRWIPVTERLPEMNTSCLLYNKYYGPMVGARIDEMRFRIPGSRFPDTPTHWMPLPEPPKEET